MYKLKFIVLNGIVQYKQKKTEKRRCAEVGQFVKRDESFVLTKSLVVVMDGMRKLAKK